MKQMTLSIVFAMAGLFSASAFAQVQGDSCEMKFSVHTDTFILFSKGVGRGVVTCKDAAGKPLAAPASVDIAIEGFGPGIGAFNVRGVASNIQINAPEQLVGTYFVGQGAIGAGAAAGDVMGFKNEQSALAFQADMRSVHGGGLFLNATRWTITLAR